MKGMNFNYLINKLSFFSSPRFEWRNNSEQFALVHTREGRYSIL